MKKNDLNQPLERSADKPSAGKRPLVAPLLISAALVLAVVAAFWVAVVDDPDGGHPVAVAKIEDAVPSATGSVAAGGQTVATSEAPPSRAAPPAQSQQPDAVQLAGLPQLPPAIGGDPSLVEYSRFGPLPRVSPDGRRPREAYAGRSAPVPSGVAKVVIVVSGLGLSQTGTQAALDKLPQDITLAFAPYGSSLQRWVGKARESGHEVLLQIPLEPMDYPTVNPGEHTLRVSGGVENRDDLDWALGRMTSYAGVMNHMGSHFLSDERALVPFLGEIGERGLFYLDDGSVPDSLAAKVGTALAVPVLTADRVVDRDRTPDAMARELVALEAIARGRGVAVGVVTGFPASVDAIAAWAHDAQTRGIVIVPASAAANTQPDG